MLIQDIKKQKNEWKRKGWAIPELRGSKQDWYAILQELLRIIDENNAVDMNDKPILVATESPSKQIKVMHDTVLLSSLEKAPCINLKPRYINIAKTCFPNTFIT